MKLTRVGAALKAAQLERQIAGVSALWRVGRGRRRRRAEEATLQLPADLTDDAGLTEVGRHLPQVLDCNIQRRDDCAGEGSDMRRHRQQATHTTTQTNE